MNLNEYATYDGIGLAQLVASGEVTSAELAELAIAAVQQVNPQINAVIEHWSPTVSEGTGPLAGVPFLIKDLAITSAGRRVELGSRLAQGLVAESDSYLMQRFNAAGLATLGRTTTPEMAFSTETESVLQGPTRNPWDTRLSAGGSSGGSGAAVAAGIVPIAHATDAAGSIRVPASYNGLVGLKPTRGRASNGPALDEVFTGFGVQLGLSRTVRDSAALMDIVQGYAPGDPYYTAAPAEGFLAQVGRDPGRLRIGLLDTPWNGAALDPEIAEATLSVARELEALGHRVERVTAPLGTSWDSFVQANAHIWCATLVRWIDGLAATTSRPIDLSTLEPATLACYAYGLQARAVEFAGALEVRNLIARSVAGWFDDFDVLLTPTLPRLPHALDTYSRGAQTMDGLQWTARVFEHSPFTPVFNVAGTPAMSLPLAMSREQGLPIGLQFAARFGAEEVLLRLAGQLEQALPWHERRPQIWVGDD
ncbi:amidase, Asp-tRNAAsn/Glu-tRNAGln amidotransferase A subunit [Pseudomonas sp. GM102]|uniref:amidase n=1 Tax=Pseudomonas sp. GM102 TaxID=1144321 RepID=UPI00026FBCDE|nr:amidase [Pseudomonas sp. GM102]EJM07342.1 amidase, Asp-tRNAAsn/Glu-tRNAGln amidotransferase A subunit [Pseudomonas sp. GM102]